jgi:hypothetical protein
VVGSKYEPVQNEESCALLDALTEESGAHSETAGALRGGRETFVTMKLPESMTFDGTDGPKDRTDFYLAALNSHDGHRGEPAISSPYRASLFGTEGTRTTLCHELRCATMRYPIWLPAEIVLAATESATPRLL